MWGNANEGKQFSQEDWLVLVWLVGQVSAAPVVKAV
jgi:hypothetical protein